MEVARAGSIAEDATPDGPGAHASRIPLIERALESVRVILGMDVAYIAHVRRNWFDYQVVTGDGAAFGVTAQTGGLFEGTYCNLMLEGKLPSVITDAANDGAVVELRPRPAAGIGAYIGVPLILRDGRVYGTFCLLSHSPRPELGSCESRLMETLAQFMVDQLDREETNAWEQHVASTVGSIGGLIAALAARDGYTSDHSHEVVELAVATGRRLGLSGSALADLETTALLHDIGKIGIRDDVLRKPGALSEDEWTEMRRHPVIGAQIVASMPNLAHLEPAIRAEHERWDGKGYPDGLQGDDIPLASRITFVCDAFHAMTSDRPYRAALSRDAALAEIVAHTESQFCPRAAGALFAVLQTQADLVEPSRARPTSDEPPCTVAGESEGRDARHDRAADAHDHDSKRHDQAAWYWSQEGDAAKAALAGRDAILDREQADVDRAQARLERQRAR